MQYWPIPLGYSQSFSDGVDTANDQTHSALTTLDSPVFNVTRSTEANNAFNNQAVVTLSQTTTQDFTNGLSCKMGLRLMIQMYLELLI